MEIDKLVESIIAPFLEGLDKQSDGEMPYPQINEDSQNILKLFQECEYGEINALSHALNEHPDILTNFLDNHPAIAQKVSTHYGQADQNKSWEQRGNDIAAKIGYDLVDYVAGDKKVEPTKSAEPEVSFTIGDEHAFMDVSGALCEEYSHRDKIKSVLMERLKKKRS